MTVAITIKTNHAWRFTLSWFDLTAKEQKEFDYLDCGDRECATFIRYKGIVYDLGEFMRVDKRSPFHVLGYDGYASDSFFSGVLVKFDRHDMERVQIATYYS